MEEDFFSFVDFRLDDSTLLWLEDDREDEERLDLSEDDLSEFLEWLLDRGEGDFSLGTGIENGPMRTVLAGSSAN